MKKYFIYFTLCLAAFASCEQLPEDVRIYGIGCKGDAASLGCDAGEYTLEIFADGDFTASLDEKDSWIRFVSSPGLRTVSGSGDISLTLEFDSNRFSTRTAVLTLERGTNVFRFTFTQESILKDGIRVDQKGVCIAAESGLYGAKVTTQADADELSFKDVHYIENGQSGWIGKPYVKNNFIYFEAEANDSGVVRHAVITMSYQGQDASVYVTQYYSGWAPEYVKIADVKRLLTAQGEIVIDSPMVLEGVVINDHSEKNGAANRVLSADVPDLELAQKTMYIQSEDASEGIMIVFTEKYSSLADRFDCVGVDLTGLTLKREDNPVRYSISGATPSVLISSYTNDAPADKIRTIAELSDEDIYTLVTIPDVEIPVRKGSFAPIDIRYISLMTSYPMVIRDKEGASSHLMVNTDCPWSRDGNSLPKGSGSVKGVVVHEKCANFDDEGTIGDYQIRPMLRSEVNIADDASEGFSELVYEWAYCDSLGVNLVANYSEMVLYPTYPPVENPTESDAKFYCVGQEGIVPLRLCNDFTHLGPYSYGKSITEPTNGNGIFNYYGRSAHWDPYATTNTIGVLYSYYASNGKNRWSAESNGGNGSNGSAWCVPGWNREQYWCVEFSTRDMKSDNTPLNMTFGTMNHINKTGAPRNWQVKWSSDGQNWELVGEYTVPDFVVTASKQTTQIPGTKFMTVNLPDSAMGKQRVYVMLQPDEPVSDSHKDKYNAINYVAIKYNK